MLETFSVFNGDAHELKVELAGEQRDLRDRTEPVWNVKVGASDTSNGNDIVKVERIGHGWHGWPCCLLVISFCIGAFLVKYPGIPS